jgi:2,3-dihydroxybiphenyl 1,2-dioxygenase
MGVGALAYVTADVADPDAWGAFAEQVLGVSLVERDGALDLRLDERAVRLRLRPAGADGPVVAGWEVADEAAAVAVAAAAGAAWQRGTDTEAAQRAVAGFVAFADPAGNRVEVCWGPQDGPGSFAGARPHGGFRTGGLGLGHVVYSMPDVDEAVTFYRDRLGFLPSDHASVPGRMFFFHVNPRHHSLALGQLGFSGCHHVMLEVLELDDLGRAYDAALDGDWPIITRLGRHSNDHVTSFYVRTPSNWAVEVGWGGLLITDEDTWQVRELTEGPSLWGHERTWVSDEMKVVQRELRRKAAADDLRAPLHVPAGAPLDVEGRTVGAGEG